ncbi:Uncharacterised protein [Citrobacter koseri]|uniref:AraC family transcriptional regulator n=1 Tax=Citrobacter koseri TaxID=545 RepID=A0A2X2WRK4_CITKO|nr:Uncharacterised protein [Citrobacter koseri]
MATSLTFTIDAAVAFCIRAREDELFSPLHHHSKRATDPGAAWRYYLRGRKRHVDGAATVCGMGSREILHSNTSRGAELCFLFIEPDAVVMPDRCCTLKITPLCRELILALAARTDIQRTEPMTQRLTQVLFDELPQQPQEQMQLPVSGHPKIRQMVETMAREPAPLAKRWGSGRACSP